MIREETYKGEKYLMLTDKGVYYLQRWFDSRTYSQITIPKSEVNYCKECTALELACYHSQRIFDEIQKKIEKQKKEKQC